MRLERPEMSYLSINLSGKGMPSKIFFATFFAFLHLVHTVLVVDGNSDIGAHVRRKFGNLFRPRPFFLIEGRLKSDFFFRKNLFSFTAVSTIHGNILRYNVSVI